MDVHLLASGAPVTTEAHHARLMRHFDCAQVLLKNGYPVGLLKLQRQPLEWEILQIQLAPELQGSGIGRRIIEDVLIDATAQSAAVRLGVLKANPARRLYERLGFEVIGEDDQEFLMLHRAPGQPSP